MEHQITSLGASVTVDEPSNETLELPNPEDAGATKQEDPTPPRMVTRATNHEKMEPEVPTGCQDQQSEVDEV